MVQQVTKKEDVIKLIIIIKDVSRYVLSRWYILFLAGIIMGSLGILYAWFYKPQYIATLTFVTENDASSQLGIYSGLAAQFGIDIGSGGSNNAFEGDNLIELLKSRNLIEKTLLSPDKNNSGKLMIETYLDDNNMRRDWNKEKRFRNVKFIQNPVNDNRVRDSITFKIFEDIIKNNLSIGKKDKKLNLIEIKLKDGNEMFAKTFIEILVNNAILYYTDYKVKKSRQNVAILQHQTDSVRNTLFGNITEAAQMNDLNVNPVRQIVHTGSQRKQVDVQVNAAVYGELLKNLELSKIALRKETPLIQIIDTPRYPLERKKPGRLLTGILFAFAGGLLTIFYLLIKYWYKFHYSLYLGSNNTASERTVE